MFIKTAFVSSIILAIAASSQAAVRDVSNISFRGDGTCMGMKIEAVYDANGAFLVVTTGARYEYVPGELKLYQGLGPSKRLLSTVKFDQNLMFEKVADTNDHVLFWSDKVNIGIYGDSTCIIAPKTDLNMSCIGNFKPDYAGRENGELLLIDNLGGMEIYPQRYEAGYTVNKIELGKVGWIANYRLKANNRVMLAGFPGRPFDWDKSFKSNVVTTCGSMGLGKDNVYGQMPSDETIRSWGQSFNVITVFFSGVYENSYINGGENPGGPYVVANEPEFKRFIATAHANNMKVLPYISFFYHYRKFKNYDKLYDEVVALKNKFGVDGVYIDASFVDLGIYKIDNKLMAFETLRRLRQLFGTNGVIMLHCSHEGQPTGTHPNSEAYCDITLVGENYPLNSLDDPYVKYHIRKYGISNSVAMWKTASLPKGTTRKQVIDKIIELNCRERMGAYVVTDTVPPGGKYVWPTTLNSEYGYYVEKLNQLKAEQSVK